jgi:hypothetical protein
MNWDVNIIMPLTDAEKEKIQETEALREELRKEFSPPQGGSRLSGFQQQAALLCLGFLLTTGAGGLLTAWWKSAESNNQRVYLARQRSLDKTYSLIERTSKEVATTLAAADDILAAYYGDEWTPKEIDERRDNWNRTSRNWRVSCQVLRAEMAASFSDPKVVTAFDQIVLKRTYLGNSIVNLPRDRKLIEKDKDLRSELQKAIALRNEIVELLYQCDSSMTAQARDTAAQSEHRNR